MFNNVGKVATAFPDKKLIFTEGCNEGYDESRIKDPKLPERYAKAMINDFNNGTVAWTDWNILLNEYGGPIMLVISVLHQFTEIQKRVK